MSTITNPVVAKCVKDRCDSGRVKCHSLCPPRLRGYYMNGGGVEIHLCIKTKIPITVLPLSTSGLIPVVGSAEMGKGFLMIRGG